MSEKEKVLAVETEEEIKEAENSENEVKDITAEDEFFMENAAKKEDTPQTKELDPDEIIARKTHRFAHEVEKATKAARKEMYRSEHIITEFGDEEVETDATLLREDYLELVASSKSQKILRGKIAGFHYAGENRKSTVLAEVKFGHEMFNVLIPSYLLFDYEVSKYVDPDKIQVIENEVRRRIGAEIRFIVRKVDEANQIAYADRLVAQSIVGYNNYIREARDEKPRVVDGMIVQGQVIQVLSKGIIVDALGCDIKIPKDELSHSYVGDAREEFHVGDKVNVRVSEISEKTVEKNGTNYRLVTAKGSIKDTMRNNKEKLFAQFKEGGMYSAEVTYVEEAGVFCRLRGNMDCLVALPRFGYMPKRGETRTIKITEKVEDKFFIYGIFVNN